MLFGFIKSPATALVAAATLSQAFSLGARTAPDSQGKAAAAANWADHGNTNTTIVHVVLFELKASLTEADKQSFCDDLLSLKDKCISPVTHQNYILSSTGGANNSPEGAEHNFTHGFVSEFASFADRDYFVFQDPDHQAFKANNRPRWLDVLVVDYEKDVY